MNIVGNLIVTEIWAPRNGGTLWAGKAEAEGMLFQWQASLEHEDVSAFVSYDNGGIFELVRDVPAELSEKVFKALHQQPPANAERGVG